MQEDIPDGFACSSPSIFVDLMTSTTFVLTSTFNSHFGQITCIDRSLSTSFMTIRPKHDV